MASPRDNSPNREARFERIANAGGAAVLAIFAITWWLTLSHLPPARLLLPSGAVMVLAIIAIASSKRWAVNAGVVVASLVGLIWIASTYRLPRLNPVEPWIELSSIPFGGVIIALLTALSASFLWTRVLRWLEAPERTRFILFLIGIAPLLLLSADLAFVGKARLQPLRPTNYHPFLTYPVDNSYGFSHASETEVLDMKGVHFRQRKPEDVIRVVLCGASTVWGFGLEDEESLPRVLQSELSTKYPQHKIEVVTVAFPGKFQLNELIDAVVTLPHWDPDVVISLNGFNEIWYGEETDRFEGMPYIEAQMRTRSTFDCLFTRFSHVGAQYFAANRDKEKSPYQLLAADNELGPRYESYLRATAANLKRNDIPYVYAFCPNINEKQLRSESEGALLGKGGDWVEQSTKRRRTSQAIIRAEQQFNYDVMTPLNNTRETLFLDECHLNAQGVKLVAADLADRLPSWCPRLKTLAD